MTEDSVEDINREILECARYGEDEDLLTVLGMRGDVNCRDVAGNTAIHRAAANGFVSCLAVLKEHKARYLENNEGNYPSHWASAHSCDL